MPSKVRLRKMAVAKHWPFMPNYRDDDSVEFIIFAFKISFLSKYRVICYEYIVNWCSGL